MSKAEAIFWGVICGWLHCNPPQWAQRRMDRKRPKDIYRWVQLRPNREPLWLIVGRRDSDGKVFRLDPMIPEILWYDGLRTPAR